MSENWGFDTTAIHAGAAPDPATGARQVPIYQTTAYVFKDAAHAARLFGLQEVGYIYSRLTNPTVGALADRVEFEPDPYVAARDAHAIAVLTEWQQFATLDYQAIYDSMVKPAFIFDGRNLLDHRALYDLGFNVYAIGKPALSHFD